MTRGPDYAYPEIRRIVYRCDDGNAQFVPACPGCGRYVKADEVITCSSADVPKVPNATCTQCGRVTMPFEGWV